MSDLKFNCPHCQQRLGIPEAALGRKIACPLCGGHIQLPKIDRPQTEPNVVRLAAKGEVRPVAELIGRARQGDGQACKELLAKGAPVIPALIQCLEEDSLEEPNLSKGAEALTDLLVAFGAPSVQPLIARLGKSRQAYLALGRLGSEEAVQALERELPSCNWRRVELACTALGLAEHTSVMQALEPLERARKATRSGEVYTAAGEAITAIQNRFRKLAERDRTNHAGH